MSRKKTVRWADVKVGMILILLDGRTAEVMSTDVRTDVNIIGLPGDRTYWAWRHTMVHVLDVDADGDLKLPREDG